MTHTSTFPAKSGQKIFYRNWKPANTPKAVVVIIHGLNSHSGYFQSFSEQLTRQDFEVYAIDLVGRGNSEGERYYISDFQSVVGDIDQLIDIARNTHPTLSLFLLGHSAGGVFASVYAVQHQDKLKGLISESFAFQVPAPGFVLSILKFLANFVPHKPVVQLKNKDFSRDAAIVEEMDSDLLIANEIQPTKTMQQLILAAAYLKKGMPQIKLPLLILHGTADQATKPEGSKYYYEHVSSPDKALKLYEGHYHDLLNDLDKEVVIADISEWLNQRI